MTLQVYKASAEDVEAGKLHAFTCSIDMGQSGY